MPKVKAALASRWAAALEPRLSEFSTGNMKVTFKLDADGKVLDFAVIANTSNEPFAKFCEQFVRETPFETPPAGALTDGQLEIPFTFTVL
jgi:TonB family protein